MINSVTTEKEINEKKNPSLNPTINKKTESQYNINQNIPVHLLIKKIESEKIIIFTFLMGKDTAESVTEKMVANKIIDATYKKAILEKFETMIKNRIANQNNDTNKNEVITLNLNKILSSDNINIIFSKIATNVDMLYDNQVI